MPILPPDTLSSDGATTFDNRIIVKSAADLSGTLLSTIDYFIDGIIDMGSQPIEVPSGGLNLSGYDFDISKLVSSAPNYSMFTSPVGGSGNIIGKDYSVEVTGTNAQVYSLTPATGNEAFEFARINYNGCTSLGEIHGYRQGFESGTGRFGGSPTLTLSGTWSGGYLIESSIVRGLSAGMSTPLFKAGSGFTMNSRFKTNFNVDLPTNASLVDFSPSNFMNASTLQFRGAIVTRNGNFDATDPNLTPNITSKDLASNWRDNNGLPNTFVGGSLGITTQTATVISTINTFVDVAASTWTTLDLQHFDNPLNGRLRNLGDTPREFKIIANLTAESTQGNNLTLRIAKWDDSAGGVVTVLDQVRVVNNLVGSRDVAFFNIDINATVDTNDYIFLQVANNTATNDVTIENGSYFIVEAR